MLVDGACCLMERCRMRKAEETGYTWLLYLTYGNEGNKS